MSQTNYQAASKRRSINLTIREDIIETAKALHLNASKAAESGILQAVQKALGEQWLQQNSAALAAHNQRIEQDGVLLNPDWAAEE